MLLHMPTFHVVFACIAGVAMLALATEWWRTGRSALGYWMAAYGVIFAMEVVNVRIEGGDFWRAAGSPAMRLFAFSLMAVGSLVFVGRRPSLLPAFVPLAWLLFWAWRWNGSALTESASERQIVSSLAFAVLCGFTALVFRRGAAGSHHERWLSVAFALHAVLVASRILFIGSISLPPGTVAADVTLTLYLIESVVFVSAASYLFVGAAKERTVGRWKAAAQTDSLTGALNREAFLEVAERHRRAARSSTLAMVDLDHFKAINDDFGHATGDEVLRIFSRTVSGLLGSEGVLGRIGGEEFVVLLVVDQPEASRRLALAFDIFTRSADALLDLRRPVTASAGLAENDGRCDLATLLARADEALYRAKRNGRDRLECAPGLGAPAAPASPQNHPIPSLATLAIR